MEGRCHRSIRYRVGVILEAAVVSIKHLHRSPEEVVRIDRLAEEIGIAQDLRNSYQPILNVTLLALDAPPVFVRTKALRALGQIVTSDPTILAAVRPLILYITHWAWADERLSIGKCPSGHRESPTRQFPGSARCCRGAHRQICDRIPRGCKRLLSKDRGSHCRM
jgi:hypothetical protein